MITLPKRQLLFVLIFLCTMVVQVSAQETPIFTFGLMTDVQYADRNNTGSRYYRKSPAKLEDVVQVFNHEKVSFVVHLGDFINDNLVSFDTLLKITGKLQMPFYLIPGNHEFGVQPGEKNKVLPMMGLRHGYHSFCHDGWRFILVDGSETGIFRYEKGSRKYEKNLIDLEQFRSEGAANALEWNGGISRKQFRWIKRNLGRSVKKGERVILCCHFPLTPDKTPELLLNAPAVKALIEKYSNVFAWFNGHVHISKWVEQNGVNYVSFKGMVEKDTNAFCIVSVFTDHLDIKGYGEEVSRILTDN